MRNKGISNIFKRQWNYRFQRISHDDGQQNGGTSGTSIASNFLFIFLFLLQFFIWSQTSGGGGGGGVQGMQLLDY